jgi:hypothetical protein
MIPRPWIRQEDDMRKWNSEIYNDNHLRLMKCHIGIAVFYFCLLLLALLLKQEAAARNLVFPVHVFILFFLTHLVLAYGSYERIELSRKASEIAFVLLMVLFPIGTLLSMFLFLPATMWQVPDDKKA